MSAAQQFYFRHKLTPLQLPLEIIYKLMIRDGFNLNWNYAPSKSYGPVSSARANAVFRINNRAADELCAYDALMKSYRAFMRCR